MTRAATAALLRDTDRGPEVLLLRRSTGARAFPGAWVFPGGAAEPGDGPPGDELTLRRTAVRETAEEAGLSVSPEGLTRWSTWLPPAEAPIRFETTCFVGAAPAGDVVVDGAEIVDSLWSTPASALRRHAAGELTLIAPTWLTLHDFVTATSVAAVLAAAPAVPPQYATEVRLVGGRTRLSTGGQRPDLDITERPWRLLPADGHTAKERRTA